ncbi:MAG TPA: sugar ABC transporter ATP-binding protein [Clostridium sp.]|uniref:sugar ABC transporter ATP-binding protein n=1 Tax=Clostridium sp. TaxID=1506 RepID=UPI002F93C2E7
MINETEYVLEMNNITKVFSGAKVLDNVTIKVKKGSVHTLMGENGAGKSTLMKILNGMYKPDGGEIILNGDKVIINNTKEALKNGISMIHQELNFIPEMTIAENMFIGREPTKHFQIINNKEIKEQTIYYLNTIGVKMNPNIKLSKLSVAEAQMVEIAKAISFNSNIIIMDEPTSAITARETEKLFILINELKKKGKSIIYISHKMEEIFKISDYITVLRDGKHIETSTAGELNNQKLISLMVGRELKDVFMKKSTKVGEVALEVKNFSKEAKFKNINFKVQKGEILGIAGLMGAGRTEIVEAIFGVNKADSGEILLKGKSVVINKPRDAIKLGLAFVSEDRSLKGLNLKFSVKENITLVNLKKYCLWNNIIDGSKEKEVAKDLVKRFNIKTHSLNQSVNNLSGGNQQKVVMAKWISGNPDVIILDEPTRGIDIGAKSEIYSIMSQLASEGKAIIMISSEMPEVIGMSDRVIVLYEGEITGEFRRDEISQEKIMACAAGHKKGEVV